MNLQPILVRLSALRLGRVVVSCRAKSNVDLPPIGIGINYRRRIHFPEEYTVKPLDVTNLGGRDPVTGRKVVNGIGGGIKHKFHWVDSYRVGPAEGPPLVDKVFQIIICGCRAAHVALIGSGDKLRYIIATENMKPGDMIKTSGHIPRNAVRPNEGDAYPLGALPLGTIVHNIEKYPGSGGTYSMAAGTFSTIVRRIGDRVIVQISSKREMSLAKECMATVGRVSNVMHNKTPIGSAQRNRELGNRPRSGLWQRKTGIHGRKIKPLPRVREINKPVPSTDKVVQFTMNL